MTGGSRIIAIGASEEDGTDVQDSQAKAEGTEPPAMDETEDAASWIEPDEEEPPKSKGWAASLPPIFAVAAITGWTGFYAWANQAAVSAQTSPSQWASLVTAWSLPALLIAALWLLSIRSSAREATRFSYTARQLSSESARLETKLSAVNRELSLAREFLASETRDLESFGRVASERLSKNADRLQELVRENGSRVETIGQVSEVALENMEKLRGQLPVISSSAKDVTNNIGNAGRTANAQVEEMVNGFNRINEFGQACEKQIHSLRTIVDETLSGFGEQCEQLEKVADARFAELNNRGAEFRTRLDKQEIDALAAIRQRASALAEELAEARASINTTEETGLESLRTRLTALRDEGDSISCSLRDSAEQVLTGWRSNLAAIEADRGALFSRIEESDAAAADQARKRLSSITAEAEMIEQGIAERAERMISELAERRVTAEAAEREAITRFSEMLGALDDEITKRSEVHNRHTGELADQVAKILDSLGASETNIGRIAEVAQTSGNQVSSSLVEITDKLTEAKSKLAEADSQFEGLTESSVRLLELVRAGTDQVRTELPRSLENSEAALAATETRARDISRTLQEAGKNGQWLANQIDGSGTALKAILADITKMQFQLRDQAISHQDSLNSLRQSLNDIVQEGDAMSQKSRTDLENAIAALESSARETVSIISEQGATGVAKIAEQIRESSAEAIGDAIHKGAAGVSGQLEQAAAHAAGVSREATIQLRDQLTKVSELVANLENRISHARERAEEQVNNDFARRAALITEALNSNAIDIAKALSTEVSDTAWEGYLRGDRGIFTRRAVSLVDSGDARTIQQVFERDPDFREHVSRYIHDFEAILRQVLSTRDGTALGVTLLSSDMGKLYVALAQAIERLRN